MIPVNQPLLNGNEKKYLVECIDTGWISSEGPFVSEFERKLAARVGRKHGVAVANGSAALDIAVQALGLCSGDEVIMPTFTIISCGQAITRTGAIPVLVDSDPATWNIDVRQIEARITERTKAIMVVHIYGLPVDMDPVLALAQRHGLKVIEDAAEAIGQEYGRRDEGGDLKCERESNGATPVMPVPSVRPSSSDLRSHPSSLRHCGSFGDISVFSFYPNKHITTGEGGMVLTDNPELAERCRSLRNLCFQAKKRFVHEEIGWNYRITNLQAALGLAQLERLDEFVARKRRMGRRYTELFSSLASCRLPLPSTHYAKNIYWVYGLVLNDEIPFDAEVAMKRLAGRGIGTRPFFWSMHEQPVFQRMGLFKGESYPVAERLARRGFYIPSGLALTDEQMDEVAAVVRSVLG